MQISSVGSPFGCTPCLAAGLVSRLHIVWTVSGSARYVWSSLPSPRTGNPFGPQGRSVDGRELGDLRQDERLALTGSTSRVAGRVASGSPYLHIGQGVETRQQRAGRDVLPCRYPRQGFSPRQSQRRGSRQAAGFHVGKVEAARTPSGCEGCGQARPRQDSAAA